MSNTLRKLALYLTLIVAAAALAGCGDAAGNGAAPPADPGARDSAPSAGGDVAVTAWEIPVLSAETGAIAYVGKPASWAAQYMADLINQAGGIRGVPVNVTVYDTQFDAARAVSHMSGVVDDALVVVGPMDAPGAESAGQIIYDGQVPNIAAYSFEDIRRQYAPYAVAYMTDSEEGDWLAAQRWVELNPDIESVVIFTCPTDTSQMATTALLQENLPGLGIQVLGVVEVDTGTLDCGPAAVQAINYGADGYLSVLRADEHAQVVIELRNRGVEEGRRITGGFSAYSSNTFDVAGDALDGTYIWNKLDPDYDGADWNTLRDAYYQDFGEYPASNPVPDYYNALLAIKLCFEELEITGDPARAGEERAAIAAWLSDSPAIDGIQGEFRWVAGKKVAPVYFFQIQGNVPKSVD